MDLDIIDFLVEYEDGSTWRMSIDAARVIADAKQLTAEIPAGNILRVVRAT